MHLARVAFLPLLCVAGCAVVAPGAPVAPAPEPLATAPTSSPPAAGVAAATAQPVPAAPPAATAAAIENGKKPAAPGSQAVPPPQRPDAAPAAATAARPAPPPASAVPAPAAPALDLNELKNQLKETSSIGAFTKLTLKSQMDDLLQQFRDHHQGKGRTTLAQLRRSYDLLLMKVLSLVQDSDRRLASAIVASREALWGLLADPKKFAALEG